MRHKCGISALRGVSALTGVGLASYRPSWRGSGGRGG